MNSHGELTRAINNLSKEMEEVSHQMGGRHAAMMFIIFSLVQQLPEQNRLAFCKSVHLMADGVKTNSAPNSNPHFRQGLRECLDHLDQFLAQQ